MVPLSRRRQQAFALAATTDTQFTLRARPKLAGNRHHEGNKQVSARLSQYKNEPTARDSRQQAMQDGHDSENNRNLDDDDDDDGDGDGDDEMKTTQRENASASSFAYLRQQQQQQQQQQKSRRGTKCQSNVVGDCCQAAAEYSCCCCWCAQSSKLTCNAVPAAAARQPASKLIRSTIKASTRPTPTTKCCTPPARTRTNQNANLNLKSKEEISQETMTKIRTVATRPEVPDEISRQQGRQTSSRARYERTSVSDYEEGARCDSRGPAAELSPLTSEDDENENNEKREQIKPPRPTNRWWRHSAGFTSASISSVSSPSLNSLTSLSSLELRIIPTQRQALETPGKLFGQLTGGTGSASVSVIASGTYKRRPAPSPPKTSTARRSHSVSNVHVASTRETSKARGELLSEQEVHAIEHFLRSHKSSVYVCGCMANLYFTKTHLADNGRSSRAASGEWKLNKTGVPVLIFDSGLAKNRQKKRLSISLTERGSGFVLWSDTIDHLSNYRAFSPSLHSIDAGGSASGQSQQQQQQHHADTCDSFHVMYLSSNHRIMVGLSFDNPLCARLFLAQIELVCSDPSNISLTGPKSQPLALGVRSATGGKLTASLSSGSLPAITTRRSLTGKLNLFGLGNANVISTTQTSRVNQSITSASWSTLKRAARLATGSQLAVPLDRAQRTDPLITVSGQERALLEAYKPRPLAQLAAEGNVWAHKTRDRRASGGGKIGRAQLKRIPRKCDISAPCLFQHVTSVDQTNLEQLYSKSFVLECQLKRTSSGAPTSGLVVPLGEPQPEVSSNTIPACSEPVGQQHEDEGASGLHETKLMESIKSRATCCLPVQVVATTKCPSVSSSSSSSSSSTSCYSSGSSSSTCSVAINSSMSRSPPSSSDSDRDRVSATGSTGQQLKWRTQRVPVGLRVTRPHVAPPKPPQRETADRVRQSTFARGAQLPTASGAPVGRTKINSILRELQSQVSGDLVDAKRRLMADIANRVGAGIDSSTPGSRRLIAGDHDHHRSTAKTSISRL